MIRLYENLNYSLDNTKRFRIELGFCQGIKDKKKFVNKDHKKNIGEFISINNNLQL